MFTTHNDIVSNNKPILQMYKQYQYDNKIFTEPSMVYYDDFINYFNENEQSYVNHGDDGEWIKVTSVNDEIVINPVKLEDGIVPDVKGMNITDAVSLLETMGWNVTFNGFGKVKSQSIEAGTELTKGKTIKLTLGVK